MTSASGRRLTAQRTEPTQAGGSRAPRGRGRSSPDAGPSAGRAQPRGGQVVGPAAVSPATRLVCQLGMRRLERKKSPSACSSLDDGKESRTPKRTVSGNHFPPPQVRFPRPLAHAAARARRPRGPRPSSPRLPGRSGRARERRRARPPPAPPAPFRRPQAPPLRRGVRGDARPGRLPARTLLRSPAAHGGHCRPPFRALVTRVPSPLSALPVPLSPGRVARVAASGAARGRARSPAAPARGRSGPRRSRTPSAVPGGGCRSSSAAGRRRLPPGAAAGVAG